MDDTHSDTFSNTLRHTLIPSILFATGFLLTVQLFIDLKKGFSLQIVSPLQCVRAVGSLLSVCAHFGVPIKILNVDWPVYHMGALASIVLFSAFEERDQQDF